MNLANFQITIYQLLNERNKSSYEFYDFIQKNIKVNKEDRCCKIDRFYCHQLLKPVSSINLITLYFLLQNKGKLRRVLQL